LSEEEKSEHIVLKPREPYGEVILPENADELAKFMDQPLQAIAEAVTGALAAGPKQWSVMAGHIVQGILKGKLFQQVSREIKELRDKGKIEDDFAEKKYGFKSWVELLKVIDEEAPDEDKLEALKAMFYGVNKVGVQDSERMLNYGLFQITKTLTSGQLLLLKTAYGAYNTGQFANSQRALLTGWAQQMADGLGHKVSGIVMRDQVPLVDQGLLSPRIDMTVGSHQQNQHWIDTKDARLTDLGIRFCKNVDTYQIAKSEAAQDE
jgi:hypothetical protein